MKKKKATGAIGYVMLFTMAIIMVIITLFMLASSKLRTIQHDVDDALADSVLAALVADDIYYFETWEGTGTAVVRFRDLDESYRLYRDCMKDAKKYPYLYAVAIAIVAYFLHNFFCYQQVICTPTIFILMGMAQSVMRYGKGEE